MTVLYLIPGKHQSCQCLVYSDRFQLIFIAYHKDLVVLHTMDSFLHSRPHPLFLKKKLTHFQNALNFFLISMQRKWKVINTYMTGKQPAFPNCGMHYHRMLLNHIRWNCTPQYNFWRAKQNIGAKKEILECIAQIASLYLSHLQKSNSLLFACKWISATAKEKKNWRTYCLKKEIQMKLRHNFVISQQQRCYIGDYHEGTIKYKWRCNERWDDWILICFFNYDNVHLSLYIWRMH